VLKVTKKFEFKQGVSIPRIIFGCGLALSLPLALSYVQEGNVILDGNVVTDPDHLLEIGEHTVTISEHEVLYSPVGSHLPSSDSKNFKKVTVPEQGPVIFIVVPQYEKKQESASL
jgi:hypothetical protein